MADETDRVQDRVQQNLQQEMEAQRRRALSAPQIEPTGECHNPRCCNDIDHGKLFCDAVCAAEYEKLKNLRK